MLLHSLMRPVLLIVLTLSRPIPASAEQQLARIGGMSLRTDAARWSVTSVSPNELLLSPTGSISGKHDAIRIVRRKGESIDTCATSARQQWPASLYDEPRLSVVSVAGRDWQRIEGHTRCRNATPTGVMLCTVHDGDLYTLTVLNRISACRNISGVLLSEHALLDEVVAGLAFTP